MQDSYPSSRASVPGQQKQPASPGGRQLQLETLKTLNPSAGGFLRRTMAPMCSHCSDGRAQLCLVHLAVRPPTPRLQLILYMQVLAHFGAGGGQEAMRGPAPPHCPKCRLWPQNKNSVGSFPKRLQPQGQDDLLKARRADSWNSSQGAGQ